MSLLLILVILLLVFGGGGFYAGGPYVGGGLGGLILLIIIVLALTGRLGRARWTYSAWIGRCPFLHRPVLRRCGAPRARALLDSNVKLRSAKGGAACTGAQGLSSSRLPRAWL